MASFWCCGAILGLISHAEMDIIRRQQGEAGTEALK